MLLPHLIEDTMMFLKQEKDPVCLSRVESEMLLNLATPLILLWLIHASVD